MAAINGTCLFQVMRIVDNVRPDRQTVMFSATFPRTMEALARRILSKPIEVQVGGRSVVCSDVEQHVVSFRLTSLFSRSFALFDTVRLFDRSVWVMMLENFMQMQTISMRANR